MRAFIAIAALVTTAVTSDAAGWVRANVYFRGWLSERAVAVSPEGLRDEARHGYSRSVHITSPSKLQQLITALNLPHLHSTRGDTRSDTYLVVDLFDSAGARTTYRSDSFYLWNTDCTRGRKVDARLRKFFEQFTPRPNQTIQPTAGRRTLKFSMIRASSPAATRALASRRSSC
ncbi:MAG TPA: hypothetical protein VJU77_10420 [Chthoniobacterales bacterium]|nr:hypothetical protein [Chthoniobacterales bacterium]